MRPQVIDAYYTYIQTLLRTCCLLHPFHGLRLNEFWLELAGKVQGRPHHLEERRNQGTILILSVFPGPDIQHFVAYSE